MIRVNLESCHLESAFFSLANARLVVFVELTVEEQYRDGQRVEAGLVKGLVARIVLHSNKSVNWGSSRTPDVSCCASHHPLPLCKVGQEEGSVTFIND